MNEHELAEGNPSPGPEGTVAYRPLREGPGTIVGPYKLLQQIGEGGFGVVYMAEQEKPVRRMVALKIIKPGMDTAQVIARFESERQALALMDHPHIAKVLDAGATDSGRPYFVMELVKGVPITEFCDKNHMPAPERLKLFLDVCHAIQHAHHKGVIHRDIKPSNVMVTLHDGVPVVKVIDFGVAKATVQKLTEKTLFTAYGQMIGTPAYMSPEQAEMSGLDIDTRSDIYSLGVLLYELLTGTTPLESKRLREVGFAEMQRMICDEEAPRPSTRLSSLGDSATILAGNRGTDPKQLARLLAGDLDWIVMKALDKDRNRRYSTPGDFALDVERYLRHEAILARPPSTVYKLRKFARRNRATVVTAALVLLTLIGGIIGTTLGMLHAGRSERVADEARQQAERERDDAVEARKETFAALEDLTANPIPVSRFLARQNSERAPRGVEREFYQRLVARFERLAAALPDTAETQSMRTRCLERVSIAYSYLGEHEAELEAARRAADLSHALQQRFPYDPVVAGMLLGSRNAIVHAQANLGNKAESARLQKENLALAEQFHQRFPDDETITNALAILLHNRALDEWNNPANFQASLDQAIALLKAEVDRGRKDAVIYLAGCLHSRAGFFANRGDVDGVSAATAQVASLARTHDLLNVQFYLCSCSTCLGQSLINADRPDAAIAAFRNATPLLERLVAGDPASIDFREGLLRAYDGLKVALRRAGRGEEADRYERQAAALQERDLQSGRESVPLLEELARRSANLAESAHRAGRTEEANAALERAVKYGRRILELARTSKSADPVKARTEFRQQATQCRIIAFAAEKLKHWPEAIEFARRQREFAQEAQAPGERLDQDLFNLLLTAHWTLLAAFTATDQMENALAAWEKMVRLAASDPGGINDGACHHLGRLVPKLTAAGKTADPSAVLAPVLAERQAKFKADPTSTEARLALRRGYRVLGLIHEKSGQYAAGVEAYDQLLAVAPAPPDGPDPQVKSERMLIWVSLIGRAICLDALGRESDAEAAWKAFYEFSGNNAASMFGERVTNLARNGQPERAVRMAEEKLRETDNGLERYNAACVYAMASASLALTPARQEELARRAIALLDKAQEAGFFNDPKQVENAKTDADLDPLRGRDDFKKRLAAWQAIKAKERDK